MYNICNTNYYSYLTEHGSHNHTVHTVLHCTIKKRCAWEGRGVVGGAQFKAVSEMPRPYVTVVLQATEHCRFAKSSLTRRGDAPNKLLNLLEQLLHKIKANRRREMGINLKKYQFSIVRKS